MSDLSPETRRLLDLAREGDRLPPGRRALLESRFFTRVAGSALVGLAAREAWAKSGLLGPLAKGIAGLAIVSSLGAGGYFALRPSRHEAMPVRTATEPTRPSVANTLAAPAMQAMALAPTAAAPVRPQRAQEAPELAHRASTVEPRELSVRRSSAATTTPAVARATNASHGSAATGRSASATAAQAQPSATPAPEPTAAPAEETAPVRVQSTLTDETRLLAEADQALRSGKTSRALALLDEHASHYPEGALSLERGAERVVALCKLHRVDGVTVRSYLNSHPNLALAERIEQACASTLSRTK